MTTRSRLPAHVRALLQPRVLAPHGAEVTLVQTHGSFVFLAGDRVYKLKKPRDFGFLDYSTLDRRRTACKAEVALNRRLTTGVYLGVEPLTREGQTFQLGGEGEVVDYAVVMRRLPADRMMDQLVERDEIPPCLLEALARRLASFYQSVDTGEAVNRRATPEAVLTNWQENLLQTLPYVGRTISSATYQRIARAVYRDLLRLRPLFQERIASGRARDGHGDLRLSAVCFEADAIQVYDCIEFSERYRYGDVAADIAFLTMDLDGHGRPDLADQFLAAFVAATGDRTLPAVLPFYTCYRAYVRGKVDSLQLDDADVSPAQKRSAARAARRRFALAASYVGRRRPRLAAVCGPDSDVRSAVGVALAGRLGAVMVDVDEDADRAQARLERGLPIAVVAASPGHRFVQDRWAQAEQGGERPLLVVCGTDAGEGVLLTGGTPTEVLRSLRLRLPSLYPPAG